MALLAVGVLTVALPALGQVPSPAAITLRPTCGDPAPPTGSPGRYTISVDGREFNPATAVLVTFDAGRGGRPESFQGRTDGFGRFTVDIAPGRRPPGRYVVRADDFKQREATATFVVPCVPPPVTGAGGGTTTPPAVSSSPAGPPSLKLEPPIGRPGFVTAAVGTGFPPNAPVALTWSPGITAKPAVPLVADAAGRFRVPMLIFYSDRVGRRQLKAIPAGPVAFPEAAADFLVVPGRLQPPDFRDRS